MSRPIQRKSSFLLLELLVALALVTTCIFPLLKPHRAMNKTSYARLEKMQLERQARLVFLNIKKQLYEQGLSSWKEIKAGLPPQEHKSALCEKYTVIFFTETKECCTKRSSNISYLLLNVHISFVRNKDERGSFTFPLLLEGHPK